MIKKNYLMIFPVLALAGCSTINTGNDMVDTIYNGTSAILEGRDKNCEQIHPLVRESCLKAKQDAVDAVNKSIGTVTGN